MTFLYPGFPPIFQHWMTADQLYSQLSLENRFHSSPSARLIDSQYFIWAITETNGVNWSLPVFVPYMQIPYCTHHFTLACIFEVVFWIAVKAPQWPTCPTPSSFGMHADWCVYDRAYYPLFLSRRWKWLACSWETQGCTLPPCIILRIHKKLGCFSFHTNHDNL